MGGDAKVWRGRLPAKVLSQTPPTVQLDAGGGKLITAQLDLQTPAEQKAFQKVATSNGPFVVGGTCLTRATETTMVDVEFASWTGTAGLQFQSSALIQLSEEFLRRVATEYLAE